METPIPVGTITHEGAAREIPEEKPIEKPILSEIPTLDFNNFVEPVKKKVFKEAPEIVKTEVTVQSFAESPVNMVFQAKNIEQGVAADTITEIRVMLTDDIDPESPKIIEQPDKISPVEDNLQVKEFLEEKTITHHESKHEVYADKPPQQEEKQTFDTEKIIEIHESINREVGTAPIEDKKEIHKEKPKEIMDIFDAPTETFAAEPSPPIVVKELTESTPKSIQVEQQQEQGLTSDTEKPRKVNNEKRAEATSNIAIKIKTKEPASHQAAAAPKDIMREPSKTATEKTTDSVVKSKPPAKETVRKKTIEITDKKTAKKNQEPKFWTEKEVAQEVFIKPKEAAPKQTKRTEVFDASPVKKIQESKKPIKEKVDTAPHKITVSKKMFDLVERLMEKADVPIKPAEQKQTKDVNKIPMKEKVQKKEPVIKVKKTKEKIIISVQPKDTQRDKQKTEKQKIAPVTKVEELKKVFEVIEKVAMEKPEKKKTEKKSSSHDRISNKKDSIDKKKSPQIEVIVSEKLLDTIKDVREKIPLLSKKKETNNEAKPSLPIIFSTKKEHGKQLTIDKKEVIKIKKILLEQNTRQENNHRKEEHNVLIFDSAINGEKNDDKPKKLQKPKETTLRTSEYVEISSEDKSLMIELETLKKLIEALKNHAKKQDATPIMLNLDDQAPEELIQEDGQSQNTNNTSLLLNYQLFLLLLSLSNKPLADDEIYNANHQFLHAA